MARTWLLACVAACVCACGVQGAEVARLEAKIEILERQHRRNLSFQRSQSEQIGALRARIASLEANRRKALASAPPPRSHVVVVPPAPGTVTVDKLERLYREAGRALDDLIARGHRAAVHSLVEDYLAINYHGGMLSQSLRERYISQLAKILYEVKSIAGQP